MKWRLVTENKLHFNLATYLIGDEASAIALDLQSDTIEAWSTIK